MLNVLDFEANWNTKLIDITSWIIITLKDKLTCFLRNYILHTLKLV